MASLTPNPASVGVNETKQFTQSGLTSPKWRVHGVGNITQGGLYTAPGMAGTAVVTAGESFWASYNNTLFTLNADDSLSKSTSDPGYNEQARSNVRLNQIGDYLEIYAPAASPHRLGLQNASSDVFMVFCNPAFGFNISEKLGSEYTANVTNVAAGDLLRFEIIVGGKIRMSVNGNVRYTSVSDFRSQNLAFIIDGTQSTGTVIKPPIIGGNSVTGYNFASADLTVISPLPYGFPQAGMELLIEGQSLNLANGQAVPAWLDQTSNARHLTTSSNQPIYQVANVNGKGAVYWDGNSMTPLKHTSTFQVRCGWMVFKDYSASYPAVASGYKGILTGLTNLGILIGNAGTTFLFNTDTLVGAEIFEFRANDRIYPSSSLPAPLGAYKLIFFRFWQTQTLDGIQIGQDRADTTRRANISVAFLALSSRDFDESEVRARSSALAVAYGLTLADVYAYQPDWDGVAEAPAQYVNFYDPPEGDRVSEVNGSVKRQIDLKFSAAEPQEIQYMKKFHAEHFGTALPFLYRDYNVIPPKDIEVYLDSNYSLSGPRNDQVYSFRVKEK